MTRWPILCFLLAFAWLAAGSWQTGLAAGYLDPLSQIDAQDEALYAHSSVEMATGGEWLTPRFMHRFGLYKPPLLMWMSAAAMRVVGLNTFGLRLPAILMAALAVCLVFRMGGWLAALLTATSHLWFTLAGRALTDGLLLAAIVVAMYALWCDPQLESRRSFWMFSLAVAGAILTKSVAGAMPLLMAGAAWMMLPRGERPTWRRLLATAAVIGVVAAPWFAYQLMAHTRWFLAEHIGVEILTFGTGAPPQTSGESQWRFYAWRMLALDPLLTGLCVAALWLYWRRRRREREDTLLLAWLGIVLLSVLGWQYRNVSYLLPAVPALAIAVARVLPQRAALVVAALALGKLAFGLQPWGLPLERVEAKSAALTSKYCEEKRGRELIFVEPDDGFYSAVIGLPRIRYAFVGAPPLPHQALDLENLGIVATAADFNDAVRSVPLHAARLREWGLNDSRPLATLIQARNAAELGETIRLHPESDFLLPDKLEWVASGSHEVRHVGSGRILLAARGGSGWLNAGAAPCRWR